MAAMLGVPPEQVQVITRFLGSGFGGKLWPWSQSALAASCARNLNRPVKLVVSRSMMFQTVGHRPATERSVSNSPPTPPAKASRNSAGLCQSHCHMADDYDEGCGEATALIYFLPRYVLVTGGLVRRNVGSATSMRGPGAVPGLFALESAMDELAIKLKVDPVQLRLRNEPEKDESTGQPFSSRHLKECLTTGADKFGWSRRNSAIGSMKNPEGMTLGWGVAAGTWIAVRTEAEATVELLQNGTARVVCGTQDIGTGTYTAIAQMVSHEIGIPCAKGGCRPRRFRTPSRPYQWRFLGLLPPSRLRCWRPRKRQQKRFWWWQLVLRTIPSRAGRRRNSNWQTGVSA